MEVIDFDDRKASDSSTSSFKQDFSSLIRPKTSARLNAQNEPKTISTRIVFLQLGQIDTRNERYDAEIFIESSWNDESLIDYVIDTFDLNRTFKLTDEATSIEKLKHIYFRLKSLVYNRTLHWSPELYIENAIGDIKEELQYRFELCEKVHGKCTTPSMDMLLKHLDNLTVRVYELKKIRGVFYERLELYDFPMDIQELSITLASKKSNTEVHIVESSESPCTINVEEFFDQQEWDLFDYVETSSKLINDQWHKYLRSSFTATGFIARKPGYYLYNAYMLIFLITVLGFVPFSFDPAGPQFRAQTTGLLLLTSVNFRWIITQHLPSVSYLTSLDKYAIGNLLILVLFCVWHSLIGSSVITTNKNSKIKIDNYALYIFGVLVTLHTLKYIYWFYRMNVTVQKHKKHKRSDDVLRENSCLSINDTLKNVFETSSFVNIKNDYKQNRDTLQPAIIENNIQSNGSAKSMSLNKIKVKAEKKHARHNLPPVAQDATLLMQTTY